MVQSSTPTGLESMRFITLSLGICIRFGWGVVWYAATWTREDAWECAEQMKVSVQQSPMFRGLNVKPD